MVVINSRRRFQTSKLILSKVVAVLITFIDFSHKALVTNRYYGNKETSLICEITNFPNAHLGKSPSFNVIACFFLEF